MFKIIHNDLKSSARVGEINTDHGKIQTPVLCLLGQMQVLGQFIKES